MLAGDGSTRMGKSYLCVHNLVDLYDAQLSSPNFKSYSSRDLKERCLVPFPKMTLFAFRVQNLGFKKYT